MRRDFIKQCRHLSKTMMWHIYDFRFDKAPENRADKFAIWWLNISHHAAIFTGPDTWIPQILSCGPLDGCPAVRVAPDYWPDRRENKILNECVEGLEQCWWENGTPKLFSPNLMPWQRNWVLMWKDF